MLSQRNADDFVRYLNGVSRQVIQLLDIDATNQTQAARTSFLYANAQATATQNNITNKQNHNSTNKRSQNSKSKNRDKWIPISQTAQRKSRSSNGQANKRTNCNGGEKSGNDKSPNRIYKSDVILKQNAAGKTQQRRKSTRPAGTKSRIKPDTVSQLNSDENGSLSVRQLLSNDSGSQQNQSPTSSSSSSPATSLTVTTLATSDSSPMKAFASRDHQTHKHSTFIYSSSKRELETCTLKQQASDSTIGAIGNNSSNGLETTTDAHTIDDRLTLSITDDISVLDHGSSISPPTHLSPLDPSVPSTFGTPSTGSGSSIMHHQPYYSMPLRVSHHVDPFGLPDEFHTNSSSHDQVVVSSLHIHDHHEQQLSLNQRLQQQRHPVDESRRTMTVMGRGGEIIDGPVLVSSLDRCYSHSDHPQAQNHPQHGGPHLHQHTHYHNPMDHHQNHQAHQQQHQHDHHRHHHWFLPTTTQPNEPGFQLGVNEGGSIVEPTIAPPLSPASHQSLDQVHFGAPLYHHSYYNSQQTEHLNSFQHVSDEYANTNTLGASSSSPINHLALRPEHRTHDSPLRNSQTSCLSSLDATGTTNSTNYNQHQDHSHHHSHRHEHHEAQQHHHNQQPLQHIQDSQQVVSQADEAHSLIETSSYNGVYEPQRHINNQYQQNHQHHLIPLINGIESNAVILQDINLASATWSSTEDLYSI